MSLIYNGNTVKKLIYNGTECKKMNYNGVEVYSSLDPTKSSFTEEEFIAVVNATLQSKMTIGASVTLTNTYSLVYGSTNHVYNVIGVNHQDDLNDSSTKTTNTVDLYCSKCVYGLLDSDTTIAWNNSNNKFRSWLNDTYYNDFTNVKLLMKTMTTMVGYYSHTTYTTTDKIRLLSCSEFGLNTSQYSTPKYGQEGAKYEAFSETSGCTVSDGVYRYYSAGSCVSRTFAPGSSSNGIIYSGSPANIQWGIKYQNTGAAPVIRF